MSAVRACSLGELPTVGAIRVVIGTEPVAIVRDEAGDLHAVGDTCTHAEVSLSEGEVFDCAIECWLHGSRFDLRTGEPLELPAITPIPVYSVTVQGDDVFVDVTRPPQAGADPVGATDGTTAPSIFETTGDGVPVAADQSRGARS